MTIYSFWLFDRHCKPRVLPPVLTRIGECIYQREWHTNRDPSPATYHKHTTSTGSDFLTRAAQISRPASNRTTQDDAKLIFGIVHSLRNIVRKLTDEDSFVTFNTSKYRLHYFETPSNLKFVMLSDPKMESLRLVLHQIYVQLYVEYVVKKYVLFFLRIVVNCY